MFKLFNKNKGTSNRTAVNKKTRKYKLFSSLIFIVAFGSIGAYLVFSSGASSQPVSDEQRFDQLNASASDTIGIPRPNETSVFVVSNTGCAEQLNLNVVLTPNWTKNCSVSINNVGKRIPYRDGRGYSYSIGRKTDGSIDGLYSTLKFVGDPAITRLYDGRQMMLATSTDGKVYAANYCNDGLVGFCRPVALPAPPAGVTFNSSPSTTKNGEYVVVRSSAGETFFTTASYNAGSSVDVINTYKPWKSIKGYINTDPVVVSSNGQVLVFGANGAVYYNVISATTPTWYALGGIVKSNLAIGTGVSGRILVVGVGTDNAIYTNMLTLSNSSVTSVSGYASLGGYVLGSPSVSYNKDGYARIVVRGSDNQLHINTQTNYYSNSEFTGWSGLPKLPDGKTAITP
jgi:hypothetical protein